LQFAMQNSAQPVWGDLVDGASASPLPGQTGEFFIDMPNIAHVAIAIKAVPPDLDYWWRTKDFAKFGFLEWAKSDGLATPPRWINDTVTSLNTQKFALAGANVHLFDGVIADLVAYSHFPIPPVFFQYAGSGGFTPFLDGLDQLWTASDY